jgi:transcriptional regulator with XRE-family HTH domain
MPSPSAGTVIDMVTKNNASKNAAKTVARRDAAATRDARTAAAVDATKKKPAARPRRGATASPADALVPARPRADGGLLTLARDLRAWTDVALGIANSAADLSLRVAGARLTRPSHRAAVEKAGRLFRELRESAGLTLADVGRAIDLKDVALLEQAERGKVALPFEIVLRLAAVLGRNDPIPVAMKLLRGYNPRLWSALEDLGIGRLAVQAGREREFANIYRASDAARELSDAEFAAVLAHVRTAFESALAFRAELRARDAGGDEGDVSPRKPSPHGEAARGRGPSGGKASGTGAPGTPASGTGPSGA